MSAKNEVAFAPLRQAPILALVLLVTLWAVFRIGITSSGAGDTAALSANDRSRWSTVAALVHHGTDGREEGSSHATTAKCNTYITQI